MARPQSGGSAFNQSRLKEARLGSIGGHTP